MAVSREFGAEGVGEEEKAADRGTRELVRGTSSRKLVNLPAG